MPSIALSRQMSLDPTHGVGGCGAGCAQQHMHPQRARSYSCKTASAYSSPLIGFMSETGGVPEPGGGVEPAPKDEETDTNSREIGAKARSIRMVYLSWLVVRSHWLRQYN